MMGWPQWILLGLFALEMVLVLLLHGTPRSDRWNFHSTAWSNGCILALLYWGGFFA